MAVVFGAVSDFAAPDAPARNRCPEISDELFGVISAVDDEMVLAEQLCSGVFRDFAELVVDEVDDATLVRDCHDGGLIEREFDVRQFFERLLERLFGIDPALRAFGQRLINSSAHTRYLSCS